MDVADVQSDAAATAALNEDQGFTPAPQDPNPAPTTPTPAAAGELDRVRELVLQAHPDVVPELVRGNSIDELIASVEPAQTAYQRVAEALRAGAPPTVAAETQPAESTPATDTARPPTVPAGGASNVIDPSTLGPTTKIARALAERRQQ